MHCLYVLQKINHVKVKNTMKKNKRSKFSKSFVILFAFITIIHMVLILFYGMRKEGFHEDEYYSYWTSAGYAQILPSGHYDWRTGPEMQEQFMVSEGERFQFDAVIGYQIEDVHPPLYYLCLNIIMSLFPGKFFKWFAIIVNTVFSLVTLFGVTFFFYHVMEGKDKEKYALLAAFLYAIAPSTLSNVMFARMYGMSALWNVLYACVLLMAVKQLDGSKSKFAAWTLGGALVCYLSFLTHYFSLLLPGLLTAGICIYVLIKRKHMVRMLIYGASMLMGIGLAILTYPACLGHMFGGYRGTGVLNELNLTGFGGRIRFFGNMLNEFAAGNLLGLILLCLAIALVLFGVLIKKNWKTTDEIQHREWYWHGMGLVCCIASCLILMKISLYVYGAGCRFFFPVLALMIPWMGCFTLKMIQEMLSNSSLQPLKKNGLLVCVMACLFVVLPYVKGHLDNKILFLYEDDAQKVAFAEEYKEYPLVLLCDRDNMHRTWYICNQIWPFHNIFYTDYEHIMLDSFDEPTIQSADKLVVYMDAPEEVVQKLVDENPNLDKYTLIRHDPFYYIYLLE